jgi:hypothetical protein
MAGAMEREKRYLVKDTEAESLIVKIKEVLQEAVKTTLDHMNHTRSPTSDINAILRIQPLLGTNSSGGPLECFGKVIGYRASLYFSETMPGEHPKISKMKIADIRVDFDEIIGLHVNCALFCTVSGLDENKKFAFILNGQAKDRQKLAEIKFKRWKATTITFIEDARLIPTEDESRQICENYHHVIERKGSSASDKDLLHKVYMKCRQFIEVEGAIDHAFLKDCAPSFRLEPGQKVDSFKLEKTARQTKESPQNERFALTLFRSMAKTESLIPPKSLSGDEIEGAGPKGP